MAEQQTRGQLNRKIRQDELRNLLSKQKHLEHVVDLVDKINDPKIKIDAPMMARYKIVIDTRLALIKKYIPDVKAIEITGEGGEPLPTEIVIKYVKPSNSDT